MRPATAAVSDRPANEASPAGTADPGSEPASRDPNPPTRREPVFRVCPVDPPRKYFAGDFGSPRYGGGYHLHQGVDVFARSGTKVRAPFAGRTEVSDSVLGGLGVYVHGPRGFVFNAHLSRLGRQGKVRAGTVIGYVGNTGDASGGSPHDHFEWHPGGGPAVDPYPLLRQACRGRGHSDDRPRPSRLRFLRTKLD